MINRTRIFISSAYEEDLKVPRKKIKKHLEESGHEVPIFETGDFGTWEKDTLNQCLDVVKSSDVYILLINRKCSASSKLMDGNITPTYLEYKAAKQENKHILVFVTPDIKKGFDTIYVELKKLYATYCNDHHRPPNSPFDPFENWIDEQIKSDGMAAQILKKADPFVWAFLFEIYSNREWLYEFEIAETDKNVKIISQMLSTSFRMVVGLIPKREELVELEEQAAYFLSFADYSLIMLDEKNQIMHNEGIGVKNKKDIWSNFLEQGILFLKEPKDIIQAPTFNPLVVNTIQGCEAASLYQKEEGKELLSLVGTTGEISAPEVYSLDEEEIFVVEAFNKDEKIIAFKEEKQRIYLTIRYSDYVLCLHFSLDENIKWTLDNLKAYVKEIEYAIIDENKYFFNLLKLLIGG